MNRPVCRIARMGRVDYAEAERLQERLVTARRVGEIPDVLLLLEHPEVVTVGRGEDDAAAVADIAALEAAGVPVHRVARGGGATLHCPGQIVGYPILDLREMRRDLHWYLRSLEEVIIRALGDAGCEATRREGLTGVWAGGGKIASIGVAVRGWITWHGFALNVTRRSPVWESLNPCGLAPEAVGSLEDLPGRTPSVDELHQLLSERFCEVFEREAAPADPAFLRSV